MRPPLLDEEGDELEIDLDDPDEGYSSLDFDSFDRWGPHGLTLEEIIDNALAEQEASDIRGSVAEDAGIEDASTIELLEVYADGGNSDSTTLEAGMDGYDQADH